MLSVTPLAVISDEISQQDDAEARSSNFQHSFTYNDHPCGRSQHDEGLSVLKGV